MVLADELFRLVPECGMQEQRLGIASAMQSVPAYYRGVSSAGRTHPLAIGFFRYATN
jgi:hypothetical protein